MPVTDEDAALAAIATLETPSMEQQHAQQAVNAIICNGEPFVDVHDLFAHYNVLYFRKLLLPRVEVLWSPRLTLCAGICELSKDPSTGTFTRIRLKLSTPLLQYRPRSDTINTLLHEAIHAYFFLTTSWRHARGDDGTGHGPGFQRLAAAINHHGAYDVTIYHTFHDEVASHRRHVWQCNGPCNTQPPFFGLVKRSMNRAPGKSDGWWAQHEAECGGTYVKVQEPAPTKKQWQALSARERAGRQKNKLDGWVTGAVHTTLATAEGNKNAFAQPIAVDGEDETSVKSLQDSKGTTVSTTPASSISIAGQKRPVSDASADAADDTAKKVLVECPLCHLRMAESTINEHLDTSHAS
ncbi:hypothetical protein LEMA_P053830.1 [Plenodomus lingam JN3]|uniref:Protein with SprT-like domain at the N terminus n=1 Tax=Leptosphaeria maculans (strain JN3 / isolate v23.1.3 / race Av1-4-5-6-7-8) TaxID=985895 RepID=E4ZLJ7_LEPMJ|nr:hypothetical protein LEMA_P053830.1 [Plenodomus lingam JN3]CBX92677.1 hypothetical protein LEMA_P053830.1 [Plenodomus lingam JN3]